VAKGFEQLASKEVVMRLGGIYALEGVMNTSEQYHQPVLEALSAFVRDETKTATGDGPPASDIQAAITVIGRRKTTEIDRPDLANAHVSKADLSRAVLRDANLSGANLSQANLHSALLSVADLSTADLRGADLSHADLDRRQAARRQTATHVADRRGLDRRRLDWRHGLPDTVG
jgi:hypothetical protein